jgi:hypothetical protein
LEGHGQQLDVIGGGLDPALPGRKIPASASPVASRKASNEWNPKPRL